MADVATSVSASPSNSGMLNDILLPDSSELTMLSPGVKEAMDRIFPQSATQLLQPRHFEGDENLFGRDKTSTPICNSVMHTQQLSNTTDSVSTTMSNNIGPSPLSDHRKTGREDGEGKKLVSKLRISKADLEVISSHHRLDQRDSLDGSSRACKRDFKRDNSHTYSSSECLSQGGSDSEDMCRPFASVAKARKREKQHKRKKKETTSTWQGIDQVCKNDSEEEFMSRQGNNLNDNLTMKEGAVKYHLPMKELDCRRESSQSSDTNFSETSKTSRSNMLCSVDPSVSDNSSQHTVPENGSVSEISMYKEFSLTNEDVSNISFSSSKENLQGQRGSSGQKLPKLTKCFYNLKKEKRKIRRTFPRCYVVLNRVSHDAHEKVDINTIDSTPYAVRLKYLKKLCRQGAIKCKKKKNFGMLMKRWQHTNSFVETEGTVANSEEEFECPRGGRSLRRRNQNISYAEPSESIDDLLDDVSISRSGRKKADSSLESGVSKTKKGKQNLTELNGESALHEAKEKGSTAQQKESTAVQKEKMEDNKKEKVVDKSDKGTHIVVYPRKNMETGDAVVEKARKKSEGDKGKRKSPKSATASMPSLPNSSTVSVLVNSSCLRPQYFSQNALPPPPPLRLGIPGNMLPMGPRPFISSAPLPGMTPPVIAKPQYCMMKVDGKDVLVQLVPSGLFGHTQSGPPRAVILPSSKKNFTSPPPLIPRNLPPHHFVGQSIISQTHLLSSSQGGQIPTTTVAASIHPLGASSTASFPNFLVPATLGVRTSSFSGLPVVPISQLTAFTNAHSNRPVMALSSGTVKNPASVTTPVSMLSVSSTTKSTNPAVTPSSTASTVPSVVRTTPSLLTSMAAPSCTTVVHSIRAPTSITRVPVSSQSSSMRSLRVFVPGCLATGTRGHFTTLASIANTSPLTRLSASSELLPQRKRPSEELTLEQQAAKRRKLEKKYPLPPGVVIKTEPLDSITSTTKVTSSGSGPGMRSLLRQNIQVISASRASGSGNIQSIRIISPSLASALAVRSTRPVSNVVYRAATVSSGQTVLVPIPMSSVSTTITSSARTFSVAASTCTAATTTTVPTIVNSTTVSTLSTTTETTISTSGGKSSTPSASENTFSPPVLIPESESLDDRALSHTDSDNCSESSAPVLSPSTLMTNLVSSPEAQHTNGDTIEMTNAETVNCSPSCVASTAVSPSNSLTESTEVTESIAVPVPTTGQSSAAEESVSETSVSVSNIPHTSLETATSSSASSLATTSATTSSLLSSTTGLAETPTTESDTGVSAGSTSGLALVQADSLNNLLESLLTTVNNLKQLVKAQESLGLKGERLSKLQMVLKQKEESLSILREQLEEDDGKTIDNGGDGTGEDTCVNTEEGLTQMMTSVTESSLGGTMNDPFVIE